MEKILFINACVRPNSRTLELANHVLSTLSGEILEVKLYNEDLAPLTFEEIEFRHNCRLANDYSNKVFNLAKQFASAETIVISAPYWDMMFPAVLKCYFEKITVNGLTFIYGENGVPKGLCKAKRLIYVTTSGGPILRDFGFDYVTALAKGFYGIEQVTCLKAEGLDIYGANVTEILSNAKNSFKL